MWREENLRDFQEALTRARAGAALLDGTLGPDWSERIDFDNLDIMSSSRCILGQLNLVESLPPDRLWQVLKSIFNPRTLVASGFTCGFVLETIGLLFRPARIVASYGFLTRAWRRVLLERRFRRLKTLAAERSSTSNVLARQTSRVLNQRAEIAESIEASVVLFAHSDA
jgi:hypothetical protein